MKQEEFNIDELCHNLNFVHGIIQLMTTALSYGEERGMNQDSLATLMLEAEKRMDAVLDMLNTHNALKLQKFCNDADNREEAHGKGGEE